MAASAPAHHHAQSSWADLLFSNQPAWLWDADAGAFVWGNPAARKRFGNDLARFSQSMPRKAARRLSTVARFKRRPLLVQEPLIIDGSEPVALSMEGLPLSDGRPGLIVRLAPEEEISAQPQRRRRTSRKGKGRSAGRKRGAAAGKASAVRAIPKAKRRDPPAPYSPPPLTEAEMAALRSVGRRVRKMCRAKLNDGAGSAPAKATQPVQSAGAVPRAVNDEILSAFDAFLRLDGKGRIASLSGRLCRASGWTLRDYRGARLDCLAEGEEAERLLKLLNAASAVRQRPVSDDLLLQARGGELLPCRVVIGVEMCDGEAGYWCAVICLKMKPRLLRRYASEKGDCGPDRMAA